MSEPSKQRSVIRSALAMAVGTFSSRILGYVRDAVMLHLFPTTVTDAFVVAFRLPNIFRRLLGEGALSASFIPVYSDARVASAERARQVSSAVFTIVFSVAVLISVTCFVFMEPILDYLVGDPQGYAAVPGKFERTVYLSRIMIFYLVLVSTYAFHMAVANTAGYFFVPAFGATLFNFGLIVFTLLPFEIGAHPGSSMAWGVIAGGVLQMGVVAWLLWRLRVLPRLTLAWGGSEVRRVFLNMVPGLFGLGVYQVMMIVNTKFAARLGEGAQTYIYTADRILELPQSLIAVSLGAALLPRFSSLEATGERAQFLAEANQAVRMLLFLSLPAAVGMWVLAGPITEVLFMRGQFGPRDAAVVAEIVTIYGVLMLFSSLTRVTTPAFYALKNTWLPAVVAFFILCVHIVLGDRLVDEFGVVGLAMSTSATAVLNVLVLQYFFYRMIGPLGYGSIFVSVLRMIPALGALGAFAHFAYAWLHGLLGAIPEGRTLALALVIGVGMLIYFGVARACGSETAVKVAGIMNRRLRR